MSTVLPVSFAETRRSLHALAELVVCVVRHDAVGRIGLVPTATGYATPPFGDSGTVVGVDGLELFRRDPAGVTRAAITTARDGAGFLAVTPGVPAELWKQQTNVGLDDRLTVDPDASRAIAGFFAFVTSAIDGLRARVGDRTDLADATLWPEGFDLATHGGRVNYGGSPGDGHHEQPYLYVGPFDRPFPAAGDPFWNAPFGASLPYRDDLSVDDAVEFFARGHQLADRPS